MCILAFQISPVIHASNVCFECVTTKFRLKSNFENAGYVAAVASDIKIHPSHPPKIS